MPNSRLKMYKNPVNLACLGTLSSTRNIYPINFKDEMNISKADYRPKGGIIFYR